jgi:hypothetical protein
MVKTQYTIPLVFSTKFGAFLPASQDSMVVAATNVVTTTTLGANEERIVTSVTISTNAVAGNIILADNGTNKIVVAVPASSTVTVTGLSASFATNMEVSTSGVGQTANVTISFNKVVNGQKNIAF